MGKIAFEAQILLTLYTVYVQSLREASFQARTYTEASKPTADDIIGTAKGYENIRLTFQISRYFCSPLFHGIRVYILQVSG